jgi:hypothetical protein
VRSPFGWWPDDQGHNEGPQSVCKPLGVIRECHERARGLRIAEQELNVACLPDTELPAEGASRALVGQAVQDVVFDSLLGAGVARRAAGRLYCLNSV